MFPLCSVRHLRQVCSRILAGGTRAPMPDIAVGQKVVVGPARGIRIAEQGKLARESTTYLFHADEIWASCEE